MFWLGVSPCNLSNSSPGGRMLAGGALSFVRCVCTAEKGERLLGRERAAAMDKEEGPAPMYGRCNG